jgi:hypothetical protein
MQPQEVTAITAVIGVIIASVGIILTSFSVTAALRSSSNTAKALADAEKRAIEQSRPMVVAELARHSNSAGEPLQGVQDLVLKNYGATPARNLRVAFDPPIPDPMPDGIRPGTGALTSSLVRRFGNAIHTLPPAAEMRNIYWLGEAGPDGRFHNKEPTFDQITVTLTYEDMAGRKYASDSFELDTDVIGLSTTSKPSNWPS